MAIDHGLNDERNIAKSNLPIQERGDRNVVSSAECGWVSATGYACFSR